MGLNVFEDRPKFWSFLLLFHFYLGGRASLCKGEGELSKGGREDKPLPLQGGEREREWGRGESKM